MLGVLKWQLCRLRPSISHRQAVVMASAISEPRLSGHVQPGHPQQSAHNPTRLWIAAPSEVPK